MRRGDEIQAAVEGSQYEPYRVRVIFDEGGIMGSRDGDLDAFVVGWEEVGRVLLNDGAAFFTDSGQSLGSEGGWDVALGDLDGDSDLDALVAHSKADTVWLNDGNGIFISTDQLLGRTITAAVGLGDLDSDGDLDALTVGWGEPARVWLNDGNGNFADSGQTLTPGHIHMHSMALGDIDGWRNGCIHGGITKSSVAQ